MIGQTLGHYEILAELGRGGMGQVFRARDTKLGRDVALKVLPNDVARDTDRLARFQREAQVLAALDCPGIVTVYSVEEDEATHVHFLTMQLVEGQSLDRILPEHGLPFARFLEIAAALADALAAAHEKGIVHRDLKPANIMIKGAWGLASAKASAQLAEAPRREGGPPPRVLRTVASSLRSRLPVLPMALVRAGRSRCWTSASRRRSSPPARAMRPEHPTPAPRLAW